MIGRILLLYAGLGAVGAGIADFANYAFTGESVIGDAIGDAVESIKTKVTGQSPMDKYDRMHKNIIEADWEITDIS